MNRYILHHKHNTSMDESTISSLSATNAQRALLIFYDLTPNAMWKNEQKPSREDMERIVNEIQISAPTNIKPTLDDLCSEKTGITRNVSIGLLKEYYRYSELKPYVTEAISQATKPTKAAIPFMLPIVVIFLLSFHIGYKEGQWYFYYDPDKIAEHLDVILKLVAPP